MVVTPYRLDEPLRERLAAIGVTVCVTYPFTSEEMLPALAKSLEETARPRSSEKPDAS